MAEPGAQRWAERWAKRRITQWVTRVRWVLLWVFSALVVLSVVLPDRVRPDPDPDVADGGESGAGAEGPDADAARGPAIRRLRPDSVGAGGAVVLELSGIEGARELPVTVASRPAEVLLRAPDRIVVRIPGGTPEGRVPVVIGLEDGARVEGEVVVVQASTRKLWRNVLGGLAFFLFGLRGVARGLRSLAGHRLRETLGLLTRSPGRALALGVALGAVTQSTLSSMAIVVGLLASRMISPLSALRVLVATHLGTALTVLFLPFGAAREALFVVALGVAWMTFGPTRTGRTLGKIAVSFGLLFYGLYLMRVGFSPLVGHPELLPYVGRLQSETVVGVVTAWSFGALVTALLQSPGASFGLVLGLSESTGLLGLRDALAILGGSSLGAGAASLVVASGFGALGRRVAGLHLGLCVVMSAIMLAGLPVFVFLADVIVAGDPAVLEYGKKLLAPRLGPHLAAGFLVAQTAAVAGVAGLIGARFVERRLAETAPSRAANVAEADPRQLAAVFAQLREALAAAHEETSTGRRAHAATVRANLEAARRQAVALASAWTTGEPLVATVMASLLTNSAIEGLLRVSERILEQDIRLSPSETEATKRVYALVAEGLDEIVFALQGGQEISHTSAQEREIRINATEAEFRRSALNNLGTETSVPIAACELVAAYEAIGNQLYRAAVTLEHDLED